MQMTIFVRNLVRENAANFETEALKIPGVKKVDVWKGKAVLECSDDILVPQLVAAFRAAGFDVAEEGAPVSADAGNAMKVCIDGMTCRSCEITVERKFKKIPGVRRVNVDAASGVAKIVCHDGCQVELKQLQETLSGDKYAVRPFLRGKRDEKDGATAEKSHPTFWRLAGLLLWCFSGVTLQKLDLFGGGASVGGGTMSFAAALVLGLVAEVPRALPFRRASPFECRQIP